MTEGDTKMISDLSETAATYYEKKQQLRDKHEALSALRSDVFGADSPDVEERARSLFSEAGAGDGGGQLGEIDELHEEIEAIEAELADLEAELMDALADVRLPFDETIERREDGPEVAFPFSDPVPEGVVRGIDEVLPGDVDDDAVELRTDEVVAFTGDVEDAIAEVDAFVTDVRNAARAERDAAADADEGYSFLG